MLYEVITENREQKTEAEDFIRELETKKVYKDRIVTQVVPLKAFYPAEDYHQDFLRLNPSYNFV